MPKSSTIIADSSAPAAAAPRGLLSRLAATAREPFAFAWRQPRWTVLMALFIAVWTCELFIVQDRTLVFPNETSDSFNFFAPKIRLTLDLLFVTTLTLVLPRRMLIAVAVGTFFAHLGLITYFKYFSKPISISTINSQWREAMVVGQFALDMFPRPAAAALLGVLAVKLALLFALRDVPALPRASAYLAGLVLALGFAGVTAFTNQRDPLHFVLTTRGVGRLGYIRGYLGAWFAEWYYLGDDKLLDQIVELRSHIYDRLSPEEANIPIHKKLVLLQAESLDTNILGYQVDGQEVTPFLNQLRSRGMYYRVRANHNRASSDSDFAALTGMAGSPHVNPYSIPNYPYEDTTPESIARCGFKTYSFHGFGGEFYNRRPGFEQMGFNQINFAEELEKNYDLDFGRWGMLDTEVLRVSAQEMRTATDPTFHFLITLTTHTPYLQLPPGKAEIFPNPSSTAEHYINNMRYLDNSLRDYITQLGQGVTVMIYSDHPTEDFPGFESDRDTERGMEFIPVYIYDTDQDLSRLQTTRNDPRAYNGTWNLIDVIRYLRHQVERNFPPPASPDTKPNPQPAAEAGATQTPRTPFASTFANAS